MKFSLSVWKYICLYFLQFSMLSASQNSAEKLFSLAQVTIAKPGSAPAQIHFPAGKEIALSSFWDGYKEKFNISADNTFKAFITTTDQIGQTHHRYKQYYRGIEVADVQYIIHEKNNRVHLANGKIINNLQIDTNPGLSEEQALAFALDHLAAERYMWQNKNNQAFIKELTGDKNASYYPQGRLVISAPLKEKDIYNYRLAYRFEIYAEKPSFGALVDVDAHSGLILNKIPLYMTDDIDGSGNTLYNGNVDIKISGQDYPRPTVPVSHWQLDDWQAFGGSGYSWRPFSDAFGSNGGYDNAWYDVLDTDPVELSGSAVELSFYQRYSVEPPGAQDPYDGWDGMNIRISTDGGVSWSVLENPLPAYDDSSLYSFGDQHGEGPGVPGWTGELNSWTKVIHDLTTYSGQTVQIRFAFASDPAYSTADGSNNDLFGWQIDNILIRNNSSTIYNNSGDTSTVNRTFVSGREVSEISGNYRLRENGRGDGIFTYNAKGATSFINSEDFVDDDITFTDSEDNAGVNAHWGMEKTYDYYLSEHNLNGWDGNGSRARAYIHWDENWTNAQYLGNGVMRFGDADGFLRGPLVSLDIVGHEFTHGVTSRTAGLIYQSEYGALNESFSDIFGAAVAYHTTGNYDWLVAGRAAKAGSPFRSMANPNSLGDPDTYKGSYWKDTYNLDVDDGGVHSNSGVQNYWFYLLVEGGSGINDNGIFYDVEAIGWQDAEQIAFRNLSVYLNPVSAYKEARIGAVNAAIDLFGEYSQQVQSVKDAWDAVGVEAAWTFSVDSFSISAKNFTAGSGQIDIVAALNNPANVAMQVTAIIEDINKTFADSLLMFDDGAHSDNADDDDIFAVSWDIPEKANLYSISLKAWSEDSNYSLLFKDIEYFSSIGPLVLKEYIHALPDTTIYPGSLKSFHFIIQNNSSTDSVFNITSRIFSLDTCAIVDPAANPAYGDIAPGASAQSDSSSVISFLPICSPGKALPFSIEIYSDMKLFWLDTFNLFVDSVITNIDDSDFKPLAFNLKQNYPNPFNPVTTINYAIGTVGTRHVSAGVDAVSLHVDLSIYNLLGQKVATLVNKKQSAGSYTVSWDARNFVSGIYIYTLQTSSGFKQSRKLILLK